MQIAVRWSTCLGRWEVVVSWHLAGAGTVKSDTDADFDVEVDVEGIVVWKVDSRKIMTGARPKWQCPPVRVRTQAPGPKPEF